MAAPQELMQIMDQWGRQLVVDRSKRTLTATQAVEYLIAALNGFRANGMLTDAEGYDASYTWTEAINWFGSHGYTEERLVVDNINGGGGWEVWPLTMSGV